MEAADLSKMLEEKWGVSAAAAVAVAAGGASAPAAEEKDELVTVAGKNCESGDILIKDIKMASPKAGDILAVFSTGAYHYSMSSNYNQLPKPAVVFTYEGKSKQVIRRQTFEDLIFIGDSDNDVEILRAAKLGVAMKNGTENAKSAADEIRSCCGRCEECGQRSGHPGHRPHRGREVRGAGRKDGYHHHGCRRGQEHQASVR